MEIDKLYSHCILHLDGEDLSIIIQALEFEYMFSNDSIEKKAALMALIDDLKG